jgi:hypothetical protein
MVVRDFDIERIAIGKSEADTPLIVDADRMLSGTITFQRLESIRWRQAQVLDSGRSVQLPQPHCRTTQNIRRQPARRAGSEETFRFGVGERPDHCGSQ